MTAPAFSIRRTTADDWLQLRSLRLEMIRDTPIAYLETLEAALAHPESYWRAQAARGVADGSIKVVAVRADGRWLGTMSGYVPTPRAGPTLVAVYVAPDVRGRAAGVTDALLDAIESWARELGGTLALEVHERNDRARAAYRSRGFVETGGSTPYALDPSEQDLHMLKAL